MTILTGMLYLIISTIFAYNFNVILQRIKKGSSKVNKYSLLATSSLVLIFFAEAISRFALASVWVLIAQLYLLATILYIAYSKKRDEENS